MIVTAIEGPMRWDVTYRDRDNNESETRHDDGYVCFTFIAFETVMVPIRGPKGTIIGGDPSSIPVTAFQFVVPTADADNMARRIAGQPMIEIAPPAQLIVPA